MEGNNIEVGVDTKSPPKKNKEKQPSQMTPKTRMLLKQLNNRIERARMIKGSPKK